MNSWFECKVSYQKIDENGKDKKVSEVYLLDAVSFTEAESRLFEQLEGIISNDFFVMGIKKSNITELHAFDEGAWWYKCKVAVSDVDEKSGKEKVINSFILIMADDLKQACIRLEEMLSPIIAPWKIVSIIESPIVDVFPYFEEEKGSENK